MTGGVVGQANRGELEHAARLGMQVRAVRDRDIKPGEVEGLQARIGQERDDACQAACHRVAQLSRRALGDGDG
jgi:hypothetical protein